MKSAQFAALSLLGLLFVVGCGGDSTPPAEEGAGKSMESEGSSENTASGTSTADLSSLDLSSPEATFKTFQENFSAGKWDQGARCLTEDSQSLLCGGMTFMAGMMAAFDSFGEPDPEKPSMKDELQKIFDKHGIDPADAPKEPPAPVEGEDQMVTMMRLMGSSIKDKPVFLNDLFTFLESKENATSNFDKIQEAKLENINIDGDTATATLIADGESKPAEFHKVNGHWLIHFTKEMLQMGDGGSDAGGAEPMTGSNEFEFDEFNYEYTESETLPAIEAVTLEAYQQAWQVTKSIENQPAGDVIKALAAECGFELFQPEKFSEQFAKSVTLNLENVSRLQVLEEVCQQVGLYPRYKLRRLGFKEGPRPYPIAFDGPFAFLVEAVDEFVPYAAGELKLTLVAAGVPTTVISQMKDVTTSAQKKDAAQLMITKVEGTGGQSLVIPQEPNTVTMLMPKVCPDHLIVTRSENLSHLVQSIEQIENIAAELNLSLPTEIQTLTFEKLVKGEEQEVGGVKVTLKQVNIAEQPNQGSSISIDYEGASSEQMTYLALDADGNAIENGGGGGFSSGNSGSYSMFLMDGVPASLKVQIITKSEPISAAFAVESIPLMHAAEMPAEMPTLEFSGDSPFSVKLIDTKEENGDTKFIVSITNDSNIDMNSVSFHIDYLDDAGKKLDDFPHSHGGQRAMFPAGETTEIEVHAFFAPEGFKTVQFRPWVANFANNHRWESDAD